MTSENDLNMMLSQLFVKALDGSISAEENELLNRQLLKSPVARRYYYDFIETYVAVNSLKGMSSIYDAPALDGKIWEALAIQEKTAPVLETEEKYSSVTHDSRPGSRTVKRQRPSKLLVYTAAVSTAAMFFLMLFVMFAPSPAPVVAFLGQSVDAAWGQNTREQVAMGELRTGTYRLEKGLAQVLFNNGAKVVVQGPASFNLTSTSSMKLLSGRTVANVTREAAGFTIDTPSGKVLDLGTEFGVYVGPTGDSEVHVFQGEVVLYPRENTRKFPLLAGKAANISPDGLPHEIELDKAAFVVSEDFVARVKAKEGDPYYRQLAQNYQLRRDSDLVACYTFEADSESPELIANKALSTYESLEGVFSSAAGSAAPSRTADRLGQNSALQFERQKNQRVTIQPDPRLCISGPLTVVAWVRVPDDKGGIIVANRKGYKVNYQLTMVGMGSQDADAAYRLKLKRYHSSTIEVGGIESRTFTLKPGKWYQIAVTHDGKIASFYIDGELLSSREYQFRAEPVLASTIIGDNDETGERFEGAIDELAIFKSVLSAQEIKQLFEAQRP